MAIDANTNMAIEPNIIIICSGEPVPCSIRSRIISLRSSGIFSDWIILSFLDNDRSISNAYRRRILKKIGFNINPLENKDADKELNKLGQALKDMNTKAVNCRYNETTKTDQYTHTPDYKINIFHALKSLQCLLYQCCEGDIDQTELNKSMRQIEKSIMHEIIDKIPEYERANWG